MQAYYQKNRDGSYDIILYVSAEEMALDLTALKHRFWGKFQEVKHTAVVRHVRIIIAGTLAISIPFSFFAKVGAKEKYAMSYVYYGTGEAQLESTAVSAKTISAAAPSYFNIDANGNLVLENISENFIAAMHDSDVRVVPFLSNHWDRQRGIRALENAEFLAAEIADAVQEYALDGVNVDIENVTEDQREAYTAFVRYLRENIPADKEVSVAVAANPYGITTGWQGSYDYSALADACDYIFLMAYDEHYDGGVPGAVASLPFVEKTIEYALSKVPPEKIVLGIPFYGRIWGEGVKGHGVSLQKIAEYADAYQTETYYDEATHTPVMKLMLTSEDKPLYAAGKALAPGTYTIYYENADSIKAKIALSAKYGLKGTGNWSAGQETADVWEYYELWLNGHYFSDITDHFAKDAILQVTADGYMQGESESLFAPTQKLTRAEAAEIFARILKLEGGDAAFTDVPDTHWGVRSIRAMEKAGIMIGYPDGSFHPEEAVSRAEMTKILARIIESSYQSDTAFSDVADTHWAKHEIAALAQMGVLTGYPDGTFRPDEQINRGEAAVILSRIREWL